MAINDIIMLDFWMIVPLFLLGSLLHFAYNFAKHDKKVAIFSAVNESFWEHIKIAFWPTFLLYLVEFIIGGYKIMSFIPSKAIALYTIPISMVAIVFSYKHFTKKNILWFDISSFFMSILIAQFVSMLMLNQLLASYLTVIIGSVFLLFLFLAFVMFTRRPPKEPDFFRDPITSKYGLKGHK